MDNNALLQEYVSLLKESPWSNSLFGRRALLQFTQLGFPHPKQEDWKGTNIIPLLTPLFRPMASATTAPTASEIDLIKEKITQLGLDSLSLAKSRAVFVNGHFMETLSQFPQDLKFTSFCCQEEQFTELDYSLESLSGIKKPLTALEWQNLAAHGPSCQINIPDHWRGDAIGLIFIQTSSSEGRMIHPRLKINVGEGAKVNFLDYHGALTLPLGRFWFNSLSMITMASGSYVEYIKIQEAPLSALETQTLKFKQMANSTLNLFTAISGGRLSRTQIEVDLVEQGARAELQGIY
ncbi:MAG: SufD family Fe-S cluster assembly protein, partial [Pseudomonadota bacterium]